MIDLLKKDINHSLEQREIFLNTLKQLPQEHVLLKTCNRVEVYAGDGLSDPKISKHLFRVVSGLESAIVGETAVQGQVKQAYLNSIKNKAISKGLNKLFQKALYVGKRVRTETNISRGAMSHSLAVIEILKQENIDLKDAQILILGVNNLNVEAIKYLIKQKSRTIFIANRTFEKAKKLSVRLGCKAIKYSSLYDALKSADIVISSTSAPHYIIKREKYSVTKDQYIFDLAFPRDVEPSIASLANVKLFNIEDIERRILSNKIGRQQEIREAERIIDEEIGKYHG